MISINSEYLSTKYPEKGNSSLLLKSKFYNTLSLYFTYNNTVKFMFFFQKWKQVTKSQAKVRSKCTIKKEKRMKVNAAKQKQKDNAGLRSHCVRFIFSFCSIATY